MVGASLARVLVPRRSPAERANPRGSVLPRLLARERREPGRLPLLCVRLALPLTLLLAPSRAAPSGLELIRGLGARPMAMGGAYTAVADDAFAVYYNPAGLAQVRGNLFHVDYTVVAPQVELRRGAGPGEAVLDRWVKAPVLAFALDLSGTLRLPPRLVFGLNAYITDNMKNAWKIRYGSQRHDIYYPVYGDMHEEQGLGIWACLGFQVLPWLLVGGGVNFQLHAKEVYGELAVDARLRPVEELSKIMIDVTTEVYPMLGVLLKPLPRLRLGFTWREASDFKFGVTGIGATGKIVIGPDRVVEVPLVVPVPLQSHYRPTQLAAGVSYRPVDALLLAADLAYQDWSTYADNAARVPEPPLRGTLVPRVGAEAAAARNLVVRAGYAYQPSPLEQQAPGQETNYVDNPVHMLSLGLGFTWQVLGFPREPAQLSAFYQLYVLVPRTFQNVHPGGPPLTSSGVFHCFGLGLRFLL